jgi:hypothetical protein
MLLFDSAPEVRTGTTFLITSWPIDIGLEAAALSLGGGKIVIRLHRVIYISINNPPQGGNRLTPTFGPPIPVMEFTSTDVDESRLAKKLDRSGGTYGISVAHVGGDIATAEVTVYIL